jgi:hypothetical protein
MNLCSDGHDEVCYEGRKCPVCEAVSEKDKEIKSLKEEVEGLQSDNNNLQEQIP